MIETLVGDPESVIDQVGERGILSNQVAVGDNVVVIMEDFLFMRVRAVPPVRDRGSEIAADLEQ